jgi:hypothetical protein
MPYYIYKADLYCQDCILDALLPEDEARRYRVAGHGDIENTLDQLARNRRINREDEYTFDSDDFPKIVFDNELEDGDECGLCAALA